MGRIQTAGKLFKALLPVAKATFRRVVGGATRAGKGRVGRRAGKRILRRASKAAALGTETTLPKLGLLRRSLLPGAVLAGTGLAVNEASKSFTENEDSLFDKVLAVLPGDSAAVKAAKVERAAKIIELQDQGEAIGLEAQLDRTAQGELVASQQGINPKTLTPQALSLLGRRNASTRLFGTKEEAISILGLLFGPNAPSALAAGLPFDNLSDSLKRDIPLLRLLDRGERARLAEASQSTGPTFTGKRDQAAVQQTLTQGVPRQGPGG